MSLNPLGLGVSFDAQDQFSAVMNSAAMSFGRLDGTVDRTAGRVVSHIDSMQVATMAWRASVAGLTGAFRLADVSAEFSQQVASVGAVSGATAAELKALEDAAIGAGIATQFSPVQAVVGLGDLAQAGFDANESIALLGPTLDLAAGSLGKLTPSGAAGVAAQTMKVFGLEVDQASMAVDQLLGAVNQFALSADELPLALGTAARGALAMQQGLGETLNALGLVKNIIPGVERSATAVAVAMERMVKPEVQRALQGMGVAVADAQGNFRPFLDVIRDMIPELSKMTQQGRAGFLQKTFGTEALAGIQAILTQVEKGIKGANGEIVRGAAAIDHLRGAMNNAGGTAKNFAAALLDTFAGQRQLVTGSLETLAIVAGKPFQEALRPLVEGFIAALNNVIAAIRSIPAPTQALIAKALVAASALLAVVGGIIAAKAALAGIGAVMSAAGVSVAGIVTALAPAVAIIGLATIAVLGFRQAIDQNFGGIGDFITNAVTKAKLAFDAFVQVFSEGGFSGQVREDLNKAENMGLKNFVIRVFGIVERIKELFSGIGSGFSAAIDAARPAFAAFAEALGGITGPLMSLFETNDAADAAESFDDWSKAGERIGSVLGKIAEFMVRIGTGVIDFATGFMGHWSKITTAMQPAIDAFKMVIGDLFSLGDGSKSAGVDLEAFGMIVAHVVAAGVHFFGLLAGAVGHFTGAVIGGLKSVGVMLSGVVDIIAGIIAGDWSRVWDGFKKVAMGAISFVLNSLLGFIEAFASISDKIAGLVGFDTQMANTIRSLRQAATEGLLGTETAATAATGVGTTAFAGGQSVAIPEPTASVVTARAAAGGLGGATGEQAAQALMVASADISRAANRPAPAAQVAVYLDSEQIAARVDNASRANADNNFTPGLPVSSG